MLPLHFVRRILKGMLLPEHLKERLTDLLLPKQEIQEAYLFGSAARGTFASHSDVDVAVRVKNDFALDDGFGYGAELAAELMQGLRFNRVDVVVLNRAPPLLYYRVLRDGQRLVTRDLRQTTVRESRALSRYFDYIPQLAKIERVASARVRKGLFGQ